MIFIMIFNLHLRSFFFLINFFGSFLGWNFGFKVPFPHSSSASEFREGLSSASVLFCKSEHLMSSLMAAIGPHIQVGQVPRIEWAKRVCFGGLFPDFLWLSLRFSPLDSSSGIAQTSTMIRLNYLILKLLTDLYLGFVVYYVIYYISLVVDLHLALA